MASAAVTKRARQTYERRWAEVDEVLSLIAAEAEKPTPTMASAKNRQHLAERVVFGRS